MHRSSLAVACCILAVIFVHGVSWPQKSVAEEDSSVARFAEADVSKLAKEVRGKGWIACSRMTDKGDWDLFLMRPDGSQMENITNTPTFSEAAPRFSPDGKMMLFRRLRKGATISHDRWGFQGQVMFAKADGSDASVYGKEREYTWAVWSPDGKLASCLSTRGIEIIDLKSRKVLFNLPRKGYFQQLFWSPDGKWFVGTANVGGRNWNIMRMNARTGETNNVSLYQNCTPDWFPDSKRVIFSNRPGDQKGYGWTQLWMADADGKNRGLVYGEDGRHIYGGGLSPDGKYAIFTRCPQDGGGSERGGAPGGLMRVSDAPIIGGASPALRKLHPKTNKGPVLPLPVCWEPHWTFANIKSTKDKDTKDKATKDKATDTPEADRE